MPGYSSYFQCPAAISAMSIINTTAATARRMTCSWCGMLSVTANNQATGAPLTSSQVYQRGLRSPFQKCSGLARLLYPSRLSPIRKTRSSHRKCFIPNFTASCIHPEGLLKGHTLIQVVHAVPLTAQKEKHFAAFKGHRYSPFLLEESMISVVGSPWEIA